MLLVFSFGAFAVPIAVTESMERLEWPGGAGSVQLMLIAYLIAILLHWHGKQKQNAQQHGKQYTMHTASIPISLPLCTRTDIKQSTTLLMTLNLNTSSLHTLGEARVHAAHSEPLSRRFVCVASNLCSAVCLCGSQGLLKIHFDCVTSMRRVNYKWNSSVCYSAITRVSACAVCARACARARFCENPGRVRMKD